MESPSGSAADAEKQQLSESFIYISDTLNIVLSPAEGDCLKPTATLGAVGKVKISTELGRATERPYFSRSTEL